ncbi:MAG: hypothetical protein GX456_03590 [Verrucomicrobia bacterium]|nr:hypothetical protein [Verrucomicrobiota bacterium]
MASFDLAADPDGFSRAAGDAVGVGRREALGVRQLAAALFLCPNNVPVPISHRLGRSGRRLSNNFQRFPANLELQRCVYGRFTGCPKDLAQRMVDMNLGDWAGSSS